MCLIQNGTGPWTSPDPGPIQRLDQSGPWTRLDPIPVRTLDHSGPWTSPEPGPVRTLDQSGPWTSPDPGPVKTLTLAGIYAQGRKVEGRSKNPKGLSLAQFSICSSGSKKSRVPPWFIFLSAQGGQPKNRLFSKNFLLREGQDPPVLNCM